LVEQNKRDEGERKSRVGNRANVSEIKEEKDMTHKVAEAKFRKTYEVKKQVDGGGKCFFCLEN